MKEYLNFVWDSLSHPQSPLDLIAPIQLGLAILCWYYIVRAFIEIYKMKKNKL